RGGGARDHGPEPHRPGVRRGRGGGRAERDVSLGRLRAGEVKVFARWGRFVYRFRWATLATSGVLLALSVVSLMMGGTLQSGGPLTSNLESFQAFRAIHSELGGGNAKVATSTFDLIFKSDSMSVSDSGYQQAVSPALGPLEHDYRVVSIRSPYNVAPQGATSLTSSDGHDALVLVEIHSPGSQP